MYTWDWFDEHVAHTGGVVVVVQICFLSRFKIRVAKDNFFRHVALQRTRLSTCNLIASFFKQILHI